MKFSSAKFSRFAVFSIADSPHATRGPSTSLDLVNYEGSTVFLTESLQPFEKLWRSMSITCVGTEIGGKLQWDSRY